jgi:hypothetical protein
MVAMALLIGWMALTISSIRVDTIRIARDENKTAAVKIALAGSACVECHGVDSQNMLPIRRTLSGTNFMSWVRNTDRSFSGFNSCPSYTNVELSDAQINQMYRLMYQSGR